MLLFVLQRYYVTVYQDNIYVLFVFIWTFCVRKHSFLETRDTQFIFGVEMQSVLLLS